MAEDLKETKGGFIMAMAIFVDNGFARAGRVFSVADTPKNSAFWDQFMDWAELEFDFSHQEVEDGIRFGLGFLVDEEMWQKPLFNLALQVGESFGLTREQVKQALE